VSTPKIVLPGGAGLVGQNLIVRLKERGFTNLVVIDKHAENLQTLRRLHPDVTAELADLAEPGPWEKLLEGASVVVMLQAQIGGNDRALFVRNNVTATERVLAAMKQHGDDYTATKQAQEDLVRGSGIPHVVLRPTLMFGWFDRKHLGWLSRFMKKVPVFPIPGHGRYMRQPLYVGDFCQVIIGCIDSRPDGEVLNISGVEKIDYIDMIRAVRDAVRSRAVVLKIPYGLFDVLLRTWAVFDKNPPFTATQLKALTAGDEFEVIDWAKRFAVKPTLFNDAILETYRDPRFSSVVLAF
jgi:nucleoside-diphosphate-sugar epimerase